MIALATASTTRRRYRNHRLPRATSIDVSGSDALGTFDFDATVTTYDYAGASVGIFNADNTLSFGYTFTSKAAPTAPACAPAPGVPSTGAHRQQYPQRPDPHTTTLTGPILPRQGTHVFRRHPGRGGGLFDVFASLEDGPVQSSARTVPDLLQERDQQGPERLRLDREQHRHPGTNWKARGMLRLRRQEHAHEDFWRKPGRGTA